MNHKSAKKHEMISKTRKNFSKNKKVTNICDDIFRKSVAYQLSKEKTITI